MKRITRIKDARDLGVKLVEDQMKNLVALKGVAMTQEFLDIANFCEGAYTGAGTPSLGDKNWQFGVYLSGLNRWDDPRYVKALARLNELDPDEQKMNEQKDYFNRDHFFTWEFEGGFQIKVNLYCYENKDTSECRKIQVGVKMVEQPVYRYDCAVPEGTTELPAPVLELEHLV